MFFRNRKRIEELESQVGILSSLLDLNCKTSQNLQQMSQRNSICNSQNIRSIYSLLSDLDTRLTCVEILRKRRLNFKKLKR